jgi:hypothetical protein
MISFKNFFFNNILSSKSVALVLLFYECAALNLEFSARHSQHEYRRLEEHITASKLE